jgi:hypothetical protein
MLARDRSSHQVFAVGVAKELPQDPFGSEVRLTSSVDLLHWSERSTLLRVQYQDGIDFGWLTFAYDEQDLIALLCAEVPDPPKAHHTMIQRESLLFLRIPKFRERKPDTPPLWVGSR